MVVEDRSARVLTSLPATAGVEDAIMLVWVVPPSVEYSSLTLTIVPVFVQVMFWLEPATQISPVFGEVRVSEPLIAKAALESSVTVASAFRVIRTFTVVEIASGTVHW